MRKRPQKRTTKEEADGAEAINWWKIWERVSHNAMQLTEKAFFPSKITDFFFGLCLRVNIQCVLRILLIMRSNKRTYSLLLWWSSSPPSSWWWWAAWKCATINNRTHTHADTERERKTHKNDGNCSIAFPMDSRQKKQPCTYIIGELYACLFFARTHTQKTRKPHSTAPFSPIIVK